MENNDIVVSGSNSTLNKVTLSAYNASANTVLITADMSHGKDPSADTTMYEVGEFLSKFDTVACGSYTFTDDQKDALIYHINNTTLTTEQLARAQMFVNRYNTLHPTGLFNVANIPVKEDAAIIAAVGLISLTGLTALFFHKKKETIE